MLFIPECCICGKEQKELVRIALEDAIVDVCNSCSTFGQKVNVKPKEPIYAIKDKKDDDFEIIENFGEVIKKAREKNGIERKDFAAKIKESEKLIRKIESGDIKPDLNLAKKIEKELKIKIIEKAEKDFQKREIKKAELTIGDVVQID
ncbi:MAG: multiprotein bridging factor aMBF1 [Candidatus Aenigmarchaeota archaeon]|nr:multiprotein bridging factor aMBF1 [Candidatus Aenigmarchaeota archaeon]